MKFKLYMDNTQGQDDGRMLHTWADDYGNTITKDVIDYFEEGEYSKYGMVRNEEASLIGDLKREHRALAKIRIYLPSRDL